MLDAVAEGDRLWLGETRVVTPDNRDRPVHPAHPIARLRGQPFIVDRMTTTDRERYAAEQWFRRRGLPAVVRGKQPRTLIRVVPAVVVLEVAELLSDVLLRIDGTSDSDFDRLMENDFYAAAYTALLAGLVVLPLLAAWPAANWVRRHVLDGPAATARSTVPAAVVLAAYVVVWPIVGYLFDAADGVVSGMVTNAGLVLVLLAAVSVGGGSVLAWAGRAALRQIRSLGTLASRALPLLLLFTTFGFFTAELWQAGTALPRYRMWLVVGFFAVVAVLFMVEALSGELRQLTSSGPPATAAAKLRDSPFGRYLDDDAVPVGDHVPLRRAERVNMLLVLLLAQAFQAVVFGVLMFVFFVVFGLLVVLPDVLKAWIAHDSSAGTLFGIQLPVPNELLQVSMFLAAFSALYFVASTATDARYRESFLDPLADHMAVSLSARHVYLSRWAGAA